jgi:putative aldouronate transport system permease protein
MRLTLEAPIPIILALLLNEVRIVKFKKTVQTISYLPYFLSWVVVGSFAIIFMAEGDGVLNNFIESLGFTAIPFLTSEKLFRWTLIGTDLWKSAGWGTILYLAALAGLDKNLYEAAYIDGANRWQQTWHITLPGIKSTIVVLFILKIGGLMNAGFEQIFIMYKPGVYAVADIIDTYVYREGIQNGNYGYTTAVGLFKAIINVILLLSANYGAKKLGEKGIW